MKLALASGNPGKLAEFRSALSILGTEIVSAKELGITRFPPEAGASYEEIALVKAGFVALKSGLPALSDDSGLEVDALDGDPGIYSARFGGDLSDGERIAYLLQKLRDVPPGKRGARFVASLALATPSGQLETFRGECYGEILEAPRGEAGFGYDPIFYSEDLHKSFAQATPEEKQCVSHRARALESFMEWTLTSAGQKMLRRYALL